MMMDADDISLLCFGHRSRKAARAVTRAFNQRLKPLDLQISQFILLGAIARQADRSIAALAEDVGVESSAVLRNLKILEERRLVANAGGRGRGGRMLSVTQAGRDLITRGLPVWHDAQADMAALLGDRADETRQALVRLEAAAIAFGKLEG